MTSKQSKPSKPSKTSKPSNTSKKSVTTTKKRASTKGTKKRASSKGVESSAPKPAPIKGVESSAPKTTPMKKDAVASTAGKGVPAIKAAPPQGIAAAAAAAEKAAERTAAARGIAGPETSAKITATVERVTSRVVILEVADTNARRASEAFEALGVTAEVVDNAAELEDFIEAGPMPDMVVLGDPVPEQAKRALSGLGPERPVVVVATASQGGNARAKVRAAGADLVALRPHSRDSMGPVLIAADRLLMSRQRIRALEATEDQLRERLLRYGQADVVTGFVHFDFFKQMLVMELKRAKRYGYSLAVALIALDPWADGSSPTDEVAKTLRLRVSTAISACVRDIDLPVDFAEDRFLVFLPYTEIEGAEQVGRRIVQSTRASGSVEDDGVTHRLSVSVGIAALRPGRPVSFAQLMRDAGLALRAAQLKGGNGVVSRR